MVDRRGLAGSHGNSEQCKAFTLKAGVVVGVLDQQPRNAQTLRILTRLEPLGRTGGHAGYGLNLTRATLDASCKYPWLRRADSRKYGAYDDDADTLAWIRERQPDPRLCLEAQIMDWADDIANAVHDLADGLRGNAIPAAVLTDPAEATALAALAATHFAAEPAAATQAAANLTTLLAGTGLAKPLARSHAAITRWTETMTNRLVTLTVTATRAVYGPGRLARHHGDLIVPPQAAADAAVLRAITLRYVLRDPDRRSRWQRQRELLTDLAHCLTRYAPEALDPPFRQWWGEAVDDTSRLRVIVDQIAVLTEHDAVQRQRQLAAGAAAAAPG